MFYESSDPINTRRSSKDKNEAQANVLDVSKDLDSENHNNENEKENWGKKQTKGQTKSANIGKHRNPLQPKNQLTSDSNSLSTAFENIGSHLSDDDTSLSPGPDNTSQPTATSMQNSSPHDPESKQPSNDNTETVSLPPPSFTSTLPDFQDREGIREKEPNIKLDEETEEKKCNTSILLTTNAEPEGHREQPKQNIIEKISNSRIPASESEQSLIDSRRRMSTSSPLKNKQPEEIFSENPAIQKFFTLWKAETTGLRNFFTRSVWTGKYKRGTTNTTTCEDIIWQAMKKKPDDMGIGGNRSAKILIQISQINVGKKSSEQELDFKDPFAHAFINVELEKAAIKKITEDLSKIISWEGIKTEEVRLIDIVRHVRIQAAINEKTQANVVISSTINLIEKAPNITSDPPTHFKKEVVQEKGKDLQENADEFTALRNSEAQKRIQKSEELRQNNLDMETLIHQAMQRLDKEEELVKEFSTKHQDKFEKDQADRKSSCFPARTGLKLEDKNPYQTNFASIMNYGRRNVLTRLLGKLGFFYSGDRTYESLKELINTGKSEEKKIDPREDSRTSAEIRDALVRDKLREEKSSLKI